MRRSSARRTNSRSGDDLPAGWADAGHLCALFSAPADDAYVGASFRRLALAAGASVVEFIPDDAERIGSSRSLVEQLIAALTRIEDLRCSPVWWTADLTATRGPDLSAGDLEVLEETITERSAHLQLKVLCRYDRRLLDEATEASIRALHQSVIELGSPPDLRLWWTSPSRLVLSGEVDGGAARILDMALARSNCDGLLVDLGDVQFVDASGASILCRPAFSGGQVTLTRVSPLVLRVLRLSELEAMPGVTIETQP